MQEGGVFLQEISQRFGAVDLRRRELTSDLLSNRKAAGMTLVTLGAPSLNDIV
jgi:hypothetical protein